MDDPSRAVARSAVVREVSACWRRLTGGREVRDPERATLVACSGGADSAALAIALATSSGVVRIGHVVHDLRDRDSALRDRDSARALAERLGVGFDWREAPVRASGGNLEGSARRARYAALGEMASASGCRFVATAHHADDQLETVLMRVIRGAGPRGLSGVMARRALDIEVDGRAVVVVRPMLGMGRVDAEAVCGAYGWAWVEDASNRDVSMVRNAIRAEVIPALKAIRPDAAERASVTAEVCGMAAQAIERRARLVLNRATRELHDSEHEAVLERRVMSAAPIAVRCEALRTLLRDLGGEGMDRAGWGVLRPAAEAIGDGRTEPRVFRVGSIVVSVRAHEIGVTEASDV